MRLHVVCSGQHNESDIVLDVNAFKMCQYVCLCMSKSVSCHINILVCVILLCYDGRERKGRG